MTPLEPPRRRLAPAARSLWRLEGLVVTGAALAGACVVSAMAGGWWSVAAWAVVLAAGLAGLAAIPELRWRRWRWDVGEHDVQIRRGLVAVTHTVVPLRRVQHVDTRQGVIESSLDLATVVLHTAAGKHEIPALPAAEAAGVRDRIAAMTRSADDL